MRKHSRELASSPSLLAASMARFLAALLAAAAVLAVQVAQLSQAAPSTSELFRRAMLPDSTLPDAVLRILRPGTNLNERKDSGAATLAGEPPAFGYDYKGSGKRHGAATGKTTPFAAPYNYGYQGSGKRHGATAGEPAAPYNYCYHGSSKPHGGAAAGEPSPFGYSYSRSQKRPTGVAIAKDDPFEYEYHAGGGATDAAARPSPATTVFFHEEAVRVGERLPFHFPPAAPAALGFLPRRVADSVPFSTAALPGILALLGVAPGSAMAGRMEQTLSACESPAIAKEAKFCATSLEAMVELAAAALGTRDVTAVASVLPHGGAPPQPYAVRTVRRLDGSSFLACHDEPYPYTVYRCHTTGPARAYMVEMESAAATAGGGGGGGGAVTVATVCHTDTSQWNPEHVSFKLLGTKPGGAPVCHLMPYGHIIWAKNVKRSPS